MGGSTQTTSNSYDPMASFMSAYIGLKNDQRSDELWGLYQTDYLPYDKQAMANNAELMGAQKELTLQQVEQNKQLDPIRTRATQVGLEEAIRDIEASRPIKESLRAQQLQELTDSAPVAQKFYQMALEGVTPQYEQRMGEATSDVAQAYQTASGDAAREAGRLGIDPNSGRFAAMTGGLTSARAKDTAFARTAARTNERNRVETEGWNRVSTGMQARQHATSGQWAPDYGPSAVGGMPFMSGPSSFNTTNNPLTASQGYSQMAGNTFNSLASRVMGTTTTKDDGGAGALGALGAGAGMLGGAYLSGSLGTASKGLTMTPQQSWAAVASVPRSPLNGGYR